MDTSFKKFSASTEDSQFTFSYDPGNTYGDPANCWPESLTFEGYAGGGIEYEYGEKVCASITCGDEDLQLPDSGIYAYGNESAFADDVEGTAETLNDVLDAIASKGCFDDDDDWGVFEDAKCWEDVFTALLPASFECEVHEDCLPDFEEVFGARKARDEKGE